MVFRKSLPYALAQFCVVGYQWIAMIFLPLYFKRAGVSDAGVGTLLSVFSLSTLVLIFPLGVLSDRLAPRAMARVGALLMLGGFVFVSGGTGFWWFAGGTFLAGSGFTMASISIYSMFFKQMGEGRRGLEVSLLSFGGALGGGAGASLAGWWSDYQGTVGVIFPLGEVFALGLLGISLWLPSARGVFFPIVEYGSDLKRGRTWLLIAIMLVQASHSGFEHSGYALLQTEVIKISETAMGNIFFVLSVWMAVVYLVAGRLHDRAGQNPLIWIGSALIVSGAFMAVSGTAAGVYDFLLYRVLHTTGDAFFNLLILVVASIIFPKHRAGGAFAFVLTVNTASSFVFANVGGLVGQGYGFDRAFQLSGLIEVAGGLALIALSGPIRRSFSN